MTFGPSFEAPDNRGDTWVGAWAADGNLYSPSNDGIGFNQAAFANVAFNRITGDDVHHLKGVTVTGMPEYGTGGHEDTRDGRTWKSSGCYAVDGVLYWAVARHHYGRSSGDPYFRQTVIKTSLIKSTDGGRTWARSAKENWEKPMFPTPRFATPYFIQYGQDGRAAVDNADRYVYAVSNNGFCDNGDNLILGRVRRDKLPGLNGADWQFYCGGDGMEDSAWSSGYEPGHPALEPPRPAGRDRGHLPADGPSLPYDRLVLAEPADRRGVHHRVEQQDRVGLLPGAQALGLSWTLFEFARDLSPAGLLYAGGAPEIHRPGWMALCPDRGRFHDRVILPLDGGAVANRLGGGRPPPPPAGYRRPRKARRGLRPALRYSLRPGRIALQWIPAGVFEMGSANGGCSTTSAL